MTGKRWCRLKSTSTGRLSPQLREVGLLSDGSVSGRLFLAVSSPCVLDFSRFPADRHNCCFRLFATGKGSAGYFLAQFSPGLSTNPVGQNSVKHLLDSERVEAPPWSLWSIRILDGVGQVAGMPPVVFNVSNSAGRLDPRVSGGGGAMTGWELGPVAVLSVPHQPHLPANLHVCFSLARRNDVLKVSSSERGLNHGMKCWLSKDSSALFYDWSSSVMSVV